MNSATTSAEGNKYNAINECMVYQLGWVVHSGKMLANINNCGAHAMNRFRALVVKLHGSTIINI